MSSRIPRLLTIGVSILCWSCRSFLDDENPGAGLDRENLLDPAPDGGCSADALDPFDQTEAPYLGGDEDVRVVVSGVTDFRCPFCAEFAGRVDELLSDSRYRDFVRFYYHHFPLNSHADALDVHVRSAAVAVQSRAAFWQLHDEIFSRARTGDALSVTEVEEWAKSNLDIDSAQFAKDVAATEIEALVLEDKSQAVRHGVDRVPAVFVCGEPLLNWMNLQGVLDHYLRY